MYQVLYTTEGCQIFQLKRNEKPPARQLQQRINLNYRPVPRLSVDFKMLPKSYRSHKFISGISDEVTNYLITVPIHKSRSEEIAKSLIENVISKQYIQDYIIIAQESAFMSSLIIHLFKN